MKTLVGILILLSLLMTIQAFRLRDMMMIAISMFGEGMLIMSFLLLK